jgi:poly-gamma-glutamate synthesis protein (capsule biosynthesis protein)
VLVHWGREYTDIVEAEQRRWARWLVNGGADAVVGAHPHVVQPLDFWRGRPVAYSLGNAVFPTSLDARAEAAWLELSVAPDGGISRVRSLIDKDSTVRGDR